MKRGEIYYIKGTNQEEGSEQRGDRPAVIVSNDKNNENSDVVEVVYMTTRPKTDLPTHVLTRSSRKLSTILCEQIYSVSKSRVMEYEGKLTKKELQALDTALAISLGLDFGAVMVAEPTKEELEKLLESMKATPPQIVIPEPAEPNVDLVKLETERDLYKKFHEDLLDILKKGAKA